MIVSPHGAGLANMLFARDGCRVVELVGRRHYAACYLIIASVLGQPYDYVSCDDRGRDLVVDPHDVVTVVRELGAAD